ncbi:MAG: response regulator [Acidobacteriota bacterium]|nr:response regulator [Acidobacteriota bacterium]
MTAKNYAQKDGNKSYKKKILLAEDDDSMRRFLEVILRKANYDVVSAEDGLVAMKAALENEFDAVVADAVMPNMTGYDLCRMLRQNADKKHIPLIILSGLNQADSTDAEDCLADAYLMKGNNLKENLTKTLTNLLAEKSNS